MSPPPLKHNGSTSHNSSSYLFKMFSYLLSMSPGTGMGQKRKKKQDQFSCLPGGLLFTQEDFVAKSVHCLLHKQSTGSLKSPSHSLSGPEC